MIGAAGCGTGSTSGTVDSSGGGSAPSAESSGGRRYLRRRGSAESSRLGRRRHAPRPHRGRARHPRVPGGGDPGSDSAPHAPPGAQRLADALRRAARDRPTSPTASCASRTPRAATSPPRSVSSSSGSGGGTFDLRIPVAAPPARARRPLPARRTSASAPRPRRDITARVGLRPRAPDRGATGARGPAARARQGRHAERDGEHPGAAAHRQPAASPPPAPRCARSTTAPPSPTSRSAWWPIRADAAAPATTDAWTPGDAFDDALGVLELALGDRAGGAGHRPAARRSSPASAGSRARTLGPAPPRARARHGLTCGRRWRGTMAARRRTTRRRCSAACRCSRRWARTSWRGSRTSPCRARSAPARSSSARATTRTRATSSAAATPARSASTPTAARSRSPRSAPGDIFGELAMFDDERRSATVEAVDDLDVLGIPGVDMRALLARHADIAVKLVIALGPAAARRQRAPRPAVLPDRAEPRRRRARPARRAGARRGGRATATSWSPPPRPTWRSSPAPRASPRAASSPCSSAPASSPRAAGG